MGDLTNKKQRQACKLYQFWKLCSQLYSQLYSQHFSHCIHFQVDWSPFLHLSSSSWCCLGNLKSWKNLGTLFERIGHVGISLAKITGCLFKWPENVIWEHWLMFKIQIHLQQRLQTGFLQWRHANVFGRVSQVHSLNKRSSDVLDTFFILALTEE